MSDTRKTTKPNVPNLRFPGFEGEWELHLLSDYCHKITRKNKGNILSNVLSNSANQGIISQSEYFDRAIANSNNTAGYYIIEQDDFVYNPRKSTAAPYGPVNVYHGGEPGIISPLYLCFKTTGINREFLFYYFKSKAWWPYMYENGDSGVRHDRVSIKDDVFFAMPIQLPPEEEQLKIAQLLSLIDQRIAVQNKVIEDLKKLKTALEERMLGQCQGKQVRLRDILIERVEKSRINNQYEVLSSTVSGIYSQREYFNKEIASADNTGYKAIHRGDVVLSPQNLWMGNINYNDRFEIGIVSPSYKVFSIDEKFDKGYIAFLLKTRKALWAYSLVSEQGASIVRRNLNYESFLEISFVIPSLKEQQATARRLSAFQQKYAMEEAFLRSLLLQKEFMLKSLVI